MRCERRRERAWTLVQMSRMPRFGTSPGAVPRVRSAVPWPRTLRARRGVALRRGTGAAAGPQSGQRHAGSVARASEGLAPRRAFLADRPPRTYSRRACLPRASRRLRLRDCSRAARLPARGRCRQARCAAPPLRFRLAPASGSPSLRCRRAAVPCVPPLPAAAPLRGLSRPLLLPPAAAAANLLAAEPHPRRRLSQGHPDPSLTPVSPSLSPIPALARLVAACRATAALDDLHATLASRAHLSHNHSLGAFLRAAAPRSTLSRFDAPSCRSGSPTPLGLRLCARPALLCLPLEHASRCVVVTALSHCLPTPAPPATPLQRCTPAEPDSRASRSHSAT
jgi:hypothetical protein